MNDSGCNNLSNEFVFPDEATTAKLLAVNTAAKNLKRQHTTTSNIHNNSNTTTNLSENNETTTELTAYYDLNEASTSSSAFIATAGYSTRLFYGSMNTTIGANTTLATHKSVIVSPQSLLKRIVNNGEHHLEQQQHTPSNGPGVSNVAAVSVLNSNEGLLGGNVSGVVTASDVCSINNNSSATEDVNNLQAISSHETKKARRVQKTTRCLTNSSNKRK